VGPRAVLNTVSKKKIPILHLDSNPDHPTQDAAKHLARNRVQVVLMQKLCERAVETQQTVSSYLLNFVFVMR
jgi:hypothetical protein